MLKAGLMPASNVEIVRPYSARLYGDPIYPHTLVVR